MNPLTCISPIQYVCHRGSTGFDETLRRRVALKVLQADYRLDPEARARLIREARSLSQLDHPNICRIHDYIEGDDSTCSSSSTSKGGRSAIPSTRGWAARRN